MPTERGAAGFTVKSGWAYAVLIAGTPAAPRVVDSRRVEISNPKDPDSAQPYHAGFGTAREAGDDLERLIASVKSYGRKSAAALMADYTRMAAVRTAGVVIGSTVDPASIGNDHIRIHALEGKLFRDVLIDGVERSGVKCSMWRERDLYAAAAKHFKIEEALLRAKVTALGKGVSGGWRAEQKAAALSAWMTLTR